MSCLQDVHLWGCFKNGICPIDAKRGVATMLGFFDHMKCIINWTTLVVHVYHEMMTLAICDMKIEDGNTQIIYILDKIEWIWPKWWSKKNGIPWVYSKSCCCNLESSEGHLQSHDQNEGLWFYMHFPLGKTTFESTPTYNLVHAKFQDEHMTLIYAWKNNKTNDEKQRQITNAFVNGGLNLVLSLPISKLD